MKRTMSLHRYLSARFGLVAVMPILIIAGLAWEFLIPQVKTNIDIQHQSMARGIAGQISSRLAEGQRQLLTLSQFINTEMPRPAQEIEELLDALCERGGLFESIYFASAREKVITHLGLARANRFRKEDLTGLDLSGRHLISGLLDATAPTWSETFLSTVSSRMAVALTIPVNEVLLIGEVTLDKFSEVISLLPVDGYFFTMVLDPHGRIIADSKRRDWGQQLDLSMAALGGEFGLSSRPFVLNGQDMLGTLVEVSPLNWHVLVAQPAKTAYAPLTAMFFLLTSGLGLALVLALATAWFQAGSMSRHIKLFILHARRISQGQYDLDIPYSKITELAALGENLTQMAALICQRENALTDSEMRLAVTLDAIPSALIGVDSALNITHWNRAVETLTGLPGTQIQGCSLERIFPRLAHQQDKIRKSMDSKNIQRSLKFQYEEKNGGTGFEDITIYPLTHAGREGAVIRIDDITQKVRIEEMLIQNEKMLSVGGLAAGMAHEINNPLAGVIQNANLLATRLSGKEIPANVKAAQNVGISMTEVADYMEARQVPRILGAIIESGRRMADIVDNMLSFARKGDASFSSHDPRVLLDKAVELAKTDYDLKKNYDFKAIEIERKYDKDLPMIACEAGKIQQVFLNILNNGAHSMLERKASQSSLVPKFILRISFSSGTDRVRFEIQDNGIGMDPATRKKIFEPFFTTKPVGAGTGLGLSVSYFIITKNHEGDMEVVSEPGRGACFIISLPTGG